MLVRARTLRTHVGALLVLACLALLSPQSTVAQDGTPTPSAEELWEIYPLDPSPTRGAEASAVASPAGSGSSRRPPDSAPARSDRAIPLPLLALVAFVAALGVMALPSIRRRRALAEPPASRLGNAAPTRSASAAASARQQHGSLPSHTAAAQSPNGHASQLDPDVCGPAALVPPDPRRAWIATIEWRHTDAESHFCVVAQAGDGEPATVIAASDPLEWPPTGPTAVQALGGAAAKLEASLVAAGWKALPPGREWYAKRFSWEQVVEEPTAAQPPGRPRPIASRSSRSRPA